MRFNRIGMRIIEDTDKMCGQNIPMPKQEPRKRYPVMADALFNAGKYFTGKEEER